MDAQNEVVSEPEDGEIIDEYEEGSGSSEFGGEYQANHDSVPVSRPKRHKPPFLQSKSKRRFFSRSLGKRAKSRESSGHSSAYTSRRKSDTRSHYESHGHKGSTPRTAIRTTPPTPPRRRSSAMEGKSPEVEGQGGKRNARSIDEDRADVIQQTIEVASNLPVGCVNGAYVPGGTEMQYLVATTVDTEPVSDDDEGSIVEVVPPSKAEEDPKSPLIITLDTTDTSDEEGDGGKGKKDRRAGSSPVKSSKGKLSPEKNRNGTTVIIANNLEVKKIKEGNHDQEKLHDGSQDNTVVEEFSGGGKSSPEEKPRSGDSSEVDEDIYVLELRNKLLAELVEKTEKAAGTSSKVPEKPLASIEDALDEEIALREVLLSQLTNRKKQLEAGAKDSGSSGSEEAEKQSKNRSLAVTRGDGPSSQEFQTKGKFIQSFTVVNPDWASESSLREVVSVTMPSSPVELHHPSPVFPLTPQFSPTDRQPFSNLRHINIVEGKPQRGNSRSRNGRGKFKQRGRTRSGDNLVHSQISPSSVGDVHYRTVRFGSDPITSPTGSSTTRKLPEHDLRNILLRNRKVEPAPHLPVPATPPLQDHNNLTALFPQFGVADTDMRQEARVHVRETSPELTITRTINFDSNQATTTTSSMHHTQVRPEEQGNFPYGSPIPLIQPNLSMDFSYQDPGVQMPLPNLNPLRVEIGPPPELDPLSIGFQMKKFSPMGMIPGGGSVGGVERCVTEFPSQQLQMLGSPPQGTKLIVPAPTTPLMNLSFEGVPLIQHSIPTVTSLHSASMEPSPVRKPPGSGAKNKSANISIIPSPKVSPKASCVQTKSSKDSKKDNCLISSESPANRYIENVKTVNRTADSPEESNKQVKSPPEAVSVPSAAEKSVVVETTKAQGSPSLDESENLPSKPEGDEKPSRDKETSPEIIVLSEPDQTNPTQRSLIPRGKTRGKSASRSPVASKSKQMIKTWTNSTTKPIQNKPEGKKPASPTVGGSSKKAADVDESNIISMSSRRGVVTRGMNMKIALAQAATLPVQMSPSDQKRYDKLKTELMETLRISPAQTQPNPATISKTPVRKKSPPPGSIASSDTGGSSAPATITIESSSESVPEQVAESKEDDVIAKAVTAIVPPAVLPVAGTSESSKPSSDIAHTKTIEIIPVPTNRRNTSVSRASVKITGNVLIHNSRQKTHKKVPTSPKPVDIPSEPIIATTKLKLKESSPTASVSKPLKASSQCDTSVSQPSMPPTISVDFRINPTTTSTVLFQPCPIVVPPMTQSHSVSTVSSCSSRPLVVATISPENTSPTQPARTISQQIVQKVIRSRAAPPAPSNSAASPSSKYLPPSVPDVTTNPFRTSVTSISTSSSIPVITVATTSSAVSSLNGKLSVDTVAVPSSPIVIAATISPRLRSLSVPEPKSSPPFSTTLLNTPCPQLPVKASPPILTTLVTTSPLNTNSLTVSTINPSSTSECVTTDTKSISSLNSTQIPQPLSKQANNSNSTTVPTTTLAKVVIQKPSPVKSSPKVTPPPPVPVSSSLAISLATTSKFDSPTPSSPLSAVSTSSKTNCSPNVTSFPSTSTSNTGEEKSGTDTIADLQTAVKNLTSRVVDTRRQVQLSFKEKELVQCREKCYNEYRRILKDLQHHSRLIAAELKMGQDIADLERKLEAMKKKRESIQLKAVDLNGSIRQNARAALTQKKLCQTLSGEVRRLGEKVIGGGRYRVPDTLVENVNEIVTTLRTLDNKQSLSLQRERGVTFKQLVLEEGSILSQSVAPLTSDPIVTINSKALSKVFPSILSNPDPLSDLSKKRKLPPATPSSTDVAPPKKHVPPPPPEAKPKPSSSTPSKQLPSPVGNISQVLKRKNSRTSEPQQNPVTVSITEESDEEMPKFITKRLFLCNPGKEENRADTTLEERLSLSATDILSFPPGTEPPADFTAGQDVRSLLKNMGSPSFSESSGGELSLIHYRPLLDLHTPICPSSFADEACSKQDCKLQHLQKTPSSL